MVGSTWLNRASHFLQPESRENGEEGLGKICSPQEHVPCEPISLMRSYFAEFHTSQ